MSLIQFFKNITNPTVLYSKDVDYALNAIRLNSDAKFARHFLSIGDKKQYNIIKESMPAVCWNFTFKGYKKNDNVIESTGLIYIDIDAEYDINKLDKSKVFAYWKSLSQKGYGVLVKVENVNLGNFRSTHKYISNELGLPSDPCAVKATQFNILSHDPDLFVNQNSFIYSAVELTVEKFKADPRLERIREEDLPPSLLIEDNQSYSVRWSNINDYVKDGDYLYFGHGKENKQQFVKACFPFKKFRRSTGRYVTLFTFAKNLLWLNPNMPNALYYRILYKYAYEAFVFPCPDDYVNAIAKSCIKYNTEGKLVPTYIKRNFIQNIDAKVGEKRQLYFDCMNNKSREMMLACVENWDFEKYGKISVNKIIQYKLAGLSNMTVKKHKDVVLNFIAELNEKKNQILEASSEVIEDYIQAAKAVFLKPIMAIGRFFKKTLVTAAYCPFEQFEVRFNCYERKAPIPLGFTDTR